MKRALIVEDSLAHAKLLLHIARVLGYAVQLQRGIVGARAACADGNRFDLYIVDIHIQASEAGGDGDGLEFVRWLRERHPAAKIIVCSSDSDCADEASRLSCTFISKGPDLTTRLVDSVQHLASSSA